MRRYIVVRATARNFSIDYTDYPGGFGGFYTPKHIQSGLLVEEGEAEIEVPWERIVHVDISVTKTYIAVWRDSFEAPAESDRTERFTTESECNARCRELEQARKFVHTRGPDYAVLGTITFLSGDIRQGLHLSHGKLEGETDLGGFSGVYLRETAEIVPVRESAR